MRRELSLIIIILLSLAACKKEKDPVTSGTVKIDNLLYGSGPYYAMGFAIRTGKLVSTLDGAQDVITIIADADIDNNVRKIFFAVNNFKDAFFLYGEYADASQAQAAFNNLTAFSEPAWQSLGDDVKPFQVWLFRTSSETYAKIRVTGTVAEKRNDKPYAECSIEWVYQPDGTKTFQK